MKAYWTLDDAVIEEFDNIDDAYKVFHRAPEIVNIKIGDKIIKIDKKDIKIVVEEIS